MESSTMTNDRKQSTPFLFQCSVQVGEDHSSQKKMVLFDARQWYRSPPVILGFLSSILFQTTAVIIVLLDGHNERKRQVANVLMMIPWRCGVFFVYPSLAVLLSVLVIRSWLTTRTRRNKPLMQCCSMLRAAVTFWATFSFGMVLNLVLASWLGLIALPVEVIMKVLYTLSITLALLGLSATWEALLTVWDEENADADTIFTFVC
jgi:hypothetical protein